MNYRALWLALAGLTLTAFGVGCTSNPAIVVQFSQAPPASMAGNANAPVTAVVLHDPHAAGVTWSCLPSGSCGSFNPTQTASGVPTTYTAPNATGSVTVTATSVTDSTKSVSATVNVTAAVPISVTISQAPPANLNVNLTAPVTATVQNDATSSGVDWSCTPVGSCGSFNPAHTASGVASTYTAPASAVNVTIKSTSTADNTKSASAATGITVPFTFSVRGLENPNDGPNFYALVGAITLDVTGKVISGVQDFNDGWTVTSPQPSGDTITGGQLTVDASGQGTLALVTNNALLGAGGTETLGVQFVNNKHAQIIEFDGNFASSGSLDFQTLPSTPSGNFSFTFSGVDSSYFPFSAGGIFAIGGSNIQSGLLDLNDAGAVTTGNVWAGTISAVDPFGRGSITSADLGVPINYYVVGPKAIRLIIVDPASISAESVSAIGSALSQGGGAFSNASLGSAVFSLQSNSYSSPAYATGGMFSTNTSAGTFSGVGDNSENDLAGTSVNASGVAISGTYSFSAVNNGYGSLTETSGNLLDFQSLGVYMVDPTINLNDPNNTSTALGGALVAELDSVLVGTGFLIPQSDTATSSFSGNYAFGAQEYHDIGGSWEFDFVGQGSMTAGSLTGTGMVSDPSIFLGGTTADSGVSFSMTPTPDGANPPGRYIPSPLGMTITANGAINNFNFPTVIYQASGDVLVWVETDTDGLWGGILEKQSLPLVAPAIAIRPPLAPRK